MGDCSVQAAGRIPKYCSAVKQQKDVNQAVAHKSSLSSS